MSRKNKYKYLVDISSPYKYFELNYKNKITENRYCGNISVFPIIKETTRKIKKINFLLLFF